MNIYIWILIFVIVFFAAMKLLKFLKNTTGTSNLTNLRKNQKEIKANGIAAQATVLSFKLRTGISRSLGPDKYRIVELSLQVNPSTDDSYQVNMEDLVLDMYIFRVQPDQTVNVKIDPNDNNNVVLDI